jgi:hypothetical protein
MQDHWSIRTTDFQTQPYTQLNFFVIAFLLFKFLFQNKLMRFFYILQKLSDDKSFPVLGWVQFSN